MVLPEQTPAQSPKKKTALWVIVGVLVILGIASASGSNSEGLAYIVVIALFYFLPSFAVRGKPNFASVFTINLLLGWTLVGSVVAMAMAVSKPQTVVVQNRPLRRPSRPAGRVRSVRSRSSQLRLFVGIVGGICHHRHCPVPRPDQPLTGLREKARTLAAAARRLMRPGHPKMLRLHDRGG